MVQRNDHYRPLEVMYVVEDMVNPPTQATVSIGTRDE
jgi:hypothetical protein